MTVKNNYFAIIKKIGESCNKVGSDSDSVKILAATKKRSLEQVKKAISIGVEIVGEGTLQEALDKMPYIKGVRKHFIGHLQTNKVKAAVEIFDVIESVDSLKLAREIDKRALDKGKVQEVYIEVNVSGEDQRHGVLYEEAEKLYSKILSFTNVKVTGLMCIAPLIDAEKTRPYFRKMRGLFEKLGLKNLSMGMSNDYWIAVEEGATEVRIGTKLFK